MLKVALCAGRIAGNVENSALASRSRCKLRAMDLHGLRKELFVRTLNETDNHFAKTRTSALLWRHSEPSQAPAYEFSVFSGWMAFVRRVVASAE